MNTQSTQENKELYHLKMQMNDKIFETDTTDLREAILLFAPPVVKTKVLFTITKGDTICVKQIFIRRARMMFTNKIFMTAFIKQLIFKQQYA